MDDPAAIDKPYLSLAARRPRLTLALMVLVAIAAWFILQTPRARRVGLTPVMLAVLQDAGLPSAGPDRAAVTIAVFTDYQCAVCRWNEAALADVARERRDVRWLFVDWPVFGPGSVLGARYALAAAEQGRYLAVHRAFMTIHGPLTANALDRAAADAGVDVVRLHRTLAERQATLKARLDRNGFDAWSLGLQGTPVYLIGPYLKVGGIDRRDLLTLIRRAERDLKRGGYGPPAQPAPGPPPAFGPREGGGAAAPAPNRDPSPARRA